MTAKYIQPFSVAEDDSLRGYSQTMIDIGAKYGSLPVDEILYDCTPLSKTYLPKLHAEYVDRLPNSLLVQRKSRCYDKKSYSCASSGKKF